MKLIADYLAFERSRIYDIVPKLSELGNERGERR